jgi:hypothetical protein
MPICSIQSHCQALCWNRENAMAGLSARAGEKARRVGSWRNYQDPSQSLLQMLIA